PEGIPGSTCLRRSHRSHGSRLLAVESPDGSVREISRPPRSRAIGVVTSTAVISQGEVWWADLPAPTGSGPGFRRPIVVVQGDALNRSRIATVVCVPLTSNLRWATAPGNVPLSARLTGLPKDSVANVSQIVALDKALLTEAVGKLSRAKMELLLAGIDVILGR